MSLALDIGSQFCRAAFMTDASQPRLVDLSAPVPTDSREGADRAVRPLAAIACRQGSQALVGESALANWHTTRNARFAGSLPTELLGGEADHSLTRENLVHYAARRAKGAVLRHFHTVAPDVWLAAPVSSVEQLRVIRACKLAKLEVVLMPPAVAIATHLNLVSGGRRGLVLDWSASRLEFSLLGDGEHSSMEPPLQLNSLSGGALIIYAMNILRTRCAIPARYPADSHVRAVERLARDVCSMPVSLLAFEDTMTLIGDRTDVLPIAGIRRLLRQELRRRFELSADSIRAWWARAGGIADCVLIGGTARNAALAYELTALLKGIGISLTTHRNPENVLVNGLAQLSVNSPLKKPAFRALACNVGIMRKKNGVISPMKILERGAALPCEWTTDFSLGELKSLKLALATDANSDQFEVVGELDLGAAELDGAPDGKISITVRAHADSWLELYACAGADRKKILMRDWLPVSWGEKFVQPPMSAACANDALD